MLKSVKKSLLVLLKDKIGSKFIKSTPSSVSNNALISDSEKFNNPIINCETYIETLSCHSAKALKKIAIFKDIHLQIIDDQDIAKGHIFKIDTIELNDQQIPYLKTPHGYVKALTNEIELTDDLPVISLIIPIYNVEKYLEECLVSLQKQTYKNIEVIMVNDGSPDNSIHIAEHFQNQDNRFILHTQANGGLSAARNKGIALAKGQYIWFIDSDDVIAENAVELMINSLQDIGADFAVGCYRRINALGPKKVGHWITDAHAKNQNNLNISNYPQIMVNATAWSKVVNYDFLIKNNLYFPVGVLYEDQLWSTKLYSSAKKFNVLKHVIYDWRIRDDQSSITQQSRSLKNLDAILKAFQSSLHEYRARGLVDIAHARAVQILSFTIKTYLSHLKHTDLDYVEILAEGLKEICKDLPLEKWSEIPTQFAAIEWLLVHKDFERVKTYLDEDGLNLKKLAATFQNGKILLKVPFWNDPAVNYPIQVLQIDVQKIQPNIHLTQAIWQTQDILLLEGWAYLPLVDPKEINPSITLTLSADKQDHQIQVDIEKSKYPYATQMSNHLINDYSEFGFKANIDCLSLKLTPKINYSLRFTLSVGSNNYTKVLNNVLKGSSATNLQPHTLTDNRCVRLIAKSKRAVILNLQIKNVLLNQFNLSKHVLSIALNTKIDLKALEIRSLDYQQNIVDKYLFPIEKNNNDQYTSKIDLSSLVIDKKLDWLVRVIDQKNKIHAIDSNNLLNECISLKKDKDHELRMINSDFGNLALVHKLYGN